MDADDFKINYFFTSPALCNHPNPTGTEGHGQLLLSWVWQDKEQHRQPQKLGSAPGRTAGADSHSPQTHPIYSPAPLQSSHPRAQGGGCWQFPCHIHQLMNDAPKDTSRSAGGAGNSSRDQAPSPPGSHSRETLRPGHGKPEATHPGTLAKPLAMNLLRFVQIPIPHHTQSSSAQHN